MWRGQALFKALVFRGDDEVVRDVVRYRQSSKRLLTLYSCFGPHSSEMVVRLDSSWSGYGCQVEGFNRIELMLLIS
jgi:hypothetical protein